MLIDSHCHLDFLKEREIEKAIDLGVKGFVIPGIKGYSYIANQLAEKYQSVFYAVGVHPLYINEAPKTALKTILDVASENPNCIAIGEIGLDFFEKNIDKDLQAHFFEKQLEIARETKKPVIIHLRKGFKEFLEITDNFKELTYIMHMFSGKLDFAKALLKRFERVYFSFGAPAIRSNAKKAIEVLKGIPEDRILVETDSPDLPPEGFRYPNVPSNLPYIGEKIAKILNKTKREFFELTFKNTEEAFNCSFQG
ncbi:TatD DNase family protein [Thermotomaculum hydrothermale]|uniref:TatD DNase family protein n=1 Tax=Thermotomaculum hydrothermale TaxID=981385 RepID=A0A7R6SZV3_9BACT|nr:TatD family hydrolase [Thermotomaculum hydrothermale]BBB33107.1 TatD DNase family protein [Thermotomaculum hydrothermale]